MGILSPRPPLPATATVEEMRADLQRYRRELQSAVLLRVVALGAGAIACVAIAWLMVLR